MQQARGMDRAVEWWHWFVGCLVSFLDDLTLMLSATTKAVATAAALIAAVSALLGLRPL